MRLSLLRFAIVFLLYVVAYSDAHSGSESEASVEVCLSTITSLQRRIFFKMIPSVFNSIIQGKLDNIHQEAINLLEVWATDLSDHCCIKAESEGNKQDLVTMKDHLGGTNDFLSKLNEWLERIHFDKNILDPYQQIISKFETLVNCLVEQVPKSSQEFNMEIEALLITFEKLKKMFA